jgi:hypothetical protein
MQTDKHWPRAAEVNDVVRRRLGSATGPGDGKANQECHITGGPWHDDSSVRTPQSRPRDGLIGIPE